MARPELFIQLEKYFIESHIKLIENLYMTFHIKLDAIS
jgi:hypothetical protein